MSENVNKPRHKMLWWIVAAIVAAIAIGGIANANSTPDLPPVSTDQLTEPTHGEVAPPITAPAPAPKPEGVPEGMYAVGPDIPAGTYRTAGAVDNPLTNLPNCYWERLRGTSGEFQDIITNGNVTATHTVTLNAGEWFNSFGCQPWLKVG